MIANGIVMSLLAYLIQLWGGASDYLIRLLQVQQNRAARLVTRSGWYTSTEVLLSQCGWMSIKQLVDYHSLLLIFKIRSEGKPVYLNQKLSRAFSRNTRLGTTFDGTSFDNLEEAATNKIRQTGKLKSDLHKRSFVPRSSERWNQLPPLLRNCQNINTFKFKLKSWIKTNTPIR